MSWTRSESSDPYSLLRWSSTLSIARQTDAASSKIASWPSFSRGRSLMRPGGPNFTASSACENGTTVSSFPHKSEMRGPGFAAASANAVRRPGSRSSRKKK